MAAVLRAIGHMLNLIKDGVKTPPKEWIDEVEKYLRYTNDLAQLDQYLWQKIFVYGSQMPGHVNRDLIGEGALLGYGAFTHHKYTTYFHDLGISSEAIAMEGEHHHGRPFLSEGPCRIRGMIYAIRPSQFIWLDNLMENGDKFIRRRVPILVPYGSEDGFPCAYLAKAWMYIGRSEYWGAMPHSLLKRVPEHFPKYDERYLFPTGKKFNLGKFTFFKPLE